MLILFIYLTIGGLLSSGLLIGKNEEIFDKDFRKSLKKTFGDLYDSDWVFITFSMIIAAMMIVFWLPFVIWCIIYYIKERD